MPSASPRATCAEPPRGENMIAETTRRAMASRLSLLAAGIPRRPAALRLPGLDDQRGHDRPTVEQVEAMFLAGTVAEATVVHQRRRAAAVEVNRLRGAARDQRIGELGERHAGVPARTAVASDREQPVTREREGRPRVSGRA